jgi:acetyl-CoA carboxylase biotin carboxylase subunit
LIAKVIVHDESREGAIDKMIGALDQLQVDGIKTTKEFQKELLQSEAFRSGDYDTGLVTKMLERE